MTYRELIDALNNIPERLKDQEATVLDYSINNNPDNHRVLVDAIVTLGTEEEMQEVVLFVDTEDWIFYG